VLLGNGDGTFQSPHHSLLEFGTYFLVAGDFDEDGRLDLAVSNTTDVAVYPGKGGGTFPAVHLFVPVGNVGARAAGGFNGDGRLDLATGGNILLGNGDGAFQPPERFAPGPFTISQLVADFNGDGRPDLASVDFGQSFVDGFAPGDVTVRLGNGDGTFQAP